MRAGNLISTAEGEIEVEDVAGYQTDPGALLAERMPAEKRDAAERRMRITRPGARP